MKENVLVESFPMRIVILIAETWAGLTLTNIINIRLMCWFHLEWVAWLP